ncbi:hypothetical protein B0J18DRAFT_409652 [Chaetomium sp. MPI-SDFR-AT-0129]|nr:hypothetical protein B0J18DRAFT_409652 [Chaetomium sp. MPI-SDFR-AT-0129]
MALALKLSGLPGPAAIAPAEKLTKALRDFQGILTEEQRKELREIKSVPDASDVLVFTARLDAKQTGGGRSVAARLHGVLASVRDFSAVIDTFVSAKPELAALVLGSVKVTIQEFKPDLELVEQRSREIRQEVKLAKAQADAQDQTLQERERQLSVGFRRHAISALSMNGTKLDSVKDWQLQQDKRRSAEQMQQVLNSLYPVAVLGMFAYESVRVKSAALAQLSGPSIPTTSTDEKRGQYLGLGVQERLDLGR